MFQVVLVVSVTGQGGQPNVPCILRYKVAVFLGVFLFDFMLKDGHPISARSPATMSESLFSPKD